ncbi:MAG: glycosyltransferase family 1 protein [Chloroflexi bacterium]|nr:MAG: glycosyltransferase family 1 protein [Chloroflexota bacterium]
MGEATWRATQPKVSRHRSSPQSPLSLVRGIAHLMLNSNAHPRRKYYFDARVIQDHFPGIGRYAYNLLAALPDELDEDESIIALFDPSALNTRFDLNRLNHPKLERIECRAPLFHPANLLRPPIAALPAVVSHYPYYVRPYISPAHSVTTLHDLIPLAQPHFVPTARDRLLIWILTALAAHASTMLITVSEASARDIRHTWPRLRKPVIVIPEAADPIFIPQSVERCAMVRAKYNLPERFVLYLASNKPHKNLVRLIEAWALLNAQRSGTAEVLVIAGHQDPRYPQAQDRARTLGIADRVHFIGEVRNDDMPALYSACALFVFPSLYEGFGLTPLEAMACGAPVACSNASSLPEVVGDAALLFDPTRPEEIAATCARILHDATLRHQMHAASLRQAARFTWAKTARRTLEVYRHVAASADGQR